MISTSIRAQIACAIILTCGWLYWALLSQHSQASYPRVGFWIEAARCAKQTGHYLMVCDPVKGEVPVEDVSLADDRGHTLILSFLARTLDIEPSERTLRTLNLTLNALGFLVLCLVLVKSVGWRSALFTAFLGAYWLGARAGPDVDAAYMGIATMTAAALILAVHSTSIASLAGVFLLLATTTIIREPVGLGAVLSVIIVALALPIALRRTRASMVRSTILLAIAFLALKVPMIPPLIRDSVLNVRATGTAAHGLSHNLFLGLGGFVDNKWGIVWDDAYAQKVMHDLHPTIEYCSDEYFRAIGRLYWSYVKADPVEALRIYLVKTGRTFSAAEGLSWPAWISVILVVGLLVWAKRRRHRPQGNRLLIAIGPTLFALSFIAQGILTHPAWTYIHPGPVLLMVVVAIVAEQTRSRATSRIS